MSLRKSSTDDTKAYETKLAIVGALDELCQTRPFSRVGITDVTKLAGIGRSSFYYHFSDKNDAVQWLSHQAFACGIDQTGRTLSWFEGHYATTRMLFRYRRLITAAAQDGGYNGAAPFYLRHRQSNLQETLMMRGVTVDGELVFQIAALAACEQKMTSAYLDGGLGDMPARTFCEYMVSVVPERLREAIEIREQ